MFKPGESGNPNGKPKGAIHLSTHIQNLLNDPDFIPDSTGERTEPIKAIIRTAVIKAKEGDSRWAEWLAKHGYGTNVDITSGGQSINQVLVRFVGENEQDTTEDN